MLKYFSPRMFLAWTLSLFAALFALGFLSNFYSSFFEIILLTFFLHTLGGLLTYRLLGKAKALVSARRSDLAIGVTFFLVLTAFGLGMFGMSNQFPRLFDARYFLLEKDQWIPFLIGGLLTIPGLARSRKFVKQGDVERSASFLLMNENVTGALVAGFFFAVYLMLASIFNQPAFDVDDIFFDSDGLLWRTRFVTDAYRDYYWRAVHPFVLLIVRPLIWLVAMFLKGDRLAAAFVLTALAGGLCVFLAWKFVKHTSGNPFFAVLITSLLGASGLWFVDRDLYFSGGDLAGFHGFAFEGRSHRCADHNGRALLRCDDHKLCPSRYRVHRSEAEFLAVGPVWVDRWRARHSADRSQQSGVSRFSAVFFCAIQFYRRSGEYL